MRPVEKRVCAVGAEEETSGVERVRDREDVQRDQPQWLAEPGTRKRRVTGGGGTSQNGKPSVAFSLVIRKNTCRYCRYRPCDVGIEHNDHTCCDCEQRLLDLERVLTPRCESWCAQCTSQRCAVRGPHDLHVRMRCERSMTYPTPVQGGDPWAAPE